MRPILLALQLLAPAPTHAVPVSPEDSVALIEHVRDQGFWFVMRWRYVATTNLRRQTPIRLPPGTLILQQPGASSMRGRTSTTTRPPGGLKEPDGISCNPEANTNWDAPMNSWNAHLIKLHNTATMWIGDMRISSPNVIGDSPVPRWSADPYRAATGIDPTTTIRHDAGLPNQLAGGFYLSFCPRFSRVQPVPLVPAAEDHALSGRTADSVLRLRANFIRVLDSAQRILPRDGWITALRLRFKLDQNLPEAAARVVGDCAAESWWCGALRGYLVYVTKGREASITIFDTVRTLMPLEKRREWEDIADLMPFSSREALNALSPQARDSATTRAWWLADPLFVEPGNDRLAEQYARRVMIEMRKGIVVDQWVDWRDRYQGPGVAEMIARFGWPGSFGPWMTASIPPFKWGDTRSLFLGFLISPQYGSPQFHTFPNWAAITDPFHASAEHWDLGAPRDVKEFIDHSWWAPEFYARYSGALVPLEFQTAFLRRSTGPVLAAATSWDTMTYTHRPPSRMIASAVVSTGPDARVLGGGDTMSVTTMRGIAVRIPAGPSVLSLENVPLGEPGTAGRARFGIDAPPGLSSIADGNLGVSDPVLIRRGKGEDVPRALKDVLSAMSGSTRLIAPQRIGLFWEIYDRARGDSLLVSVRVIRQPDASLLQRIGTAIGVGDVARDSITTGWIESISRDTTGIDDAGVIIRPRGLVIETASLTPGHYTIEVIVSRGIARASSRRDFVIVSK